MDADANKAENWRTEYKEVCQNHRAVTDFRGKLLTLLPLASGAGIYVLIPKQGPNDLAPAYLIVIGLFGVLVTLGLFLHELRGIEQCTALIALGKGLEKEMELTDGQFAREDKYYRGEAPRFRRFVNNVKGPVGAAWIIYPSVAVAWLFVAVLGLAKALHWCCS